MSGNFGDDSIRFAENLKAIMRTSLNAEGFVFHDSFSDQYFDLSKKVQMK